jgi:drug/metabolite transporter (DMT)-like permease
LIATAHLWIVFTVVAAAAQTVRNAAQRELTAKLGTAGATHVRFLFGFPFALMFLAGVALVTKEALPTPGWVFIPWVIVGALMQIAATALMLATMGGRSFVVTIAYIKTEAVQVALFGALFLGDFLSLPAVAAVIVATTGVVVMSLKPGGQIGGLKPVALGLFSGACFALSAIGYRGGILSLTGSSFVMAATYTMTAGLALQTAILTAWLVLRDRRVLMSIVANWRPSMFAGLMGALASEFWFLAFALATAASVRTVALIEVLFAQAISRFAFHQKTTPREALGIVMIVAGVAFLIWTY